MGSWLGFTYVLRTNVRPPEDEGLYNSTTGNEVHELEKNGAIISMLCQISLVNREAQSATKRTIGGLWGRIWEGTSELG